MSLFQIIWKRWATQTFPFKALNTAVRVHRQKQNRGAQCHNAEKQETKFLAHGPELCYSKTLLRKWNPNCDLHMLVNIPVNFHDCAWNTFIHLHNNKVQKSTVIYKSKRKGHNTVKWTIFLTVASLPEYWITTDFTDILFWTYTISRGTWDIDVMHSGSVIIKLQNILRTQNSEICLLARVYINPL